VTPSDSAWKSFEVGANGSSITSSGANDIRLFSNARWSGSAYRYLNTAAAGQYVINSGVHYWLNSASGTAGDVISFTQAMTLDASGNLLLGETSPVYGSRATISYNPSTHNGPIILSSSAFNTNNGAALWLGGKYDTAGNYRPFAGVLGLKENATDGNSAGYISFRTNGNAADPTERARITSAGLFGLGVASPQAMFDLAGDYKEGVVTANTGTAYTINTANGTLQILTLTGNCTFTFPTAIAGESFTLLLRQDGTGGRTETWPAAVRWPGGTAPTITSTASQTDKYIFTSDGTRWYGSNAGQAYAA
jgi:hypothetical protein